MAIGYNQVTLIGNLGKDPRMSNGNGEINRASFPLAVDRIRSDESGEARQDADWFQVVAWGRLAEICRDYLAKGSLVLITGRLQSRNWQDQEGTWHNLTEIVAHEVVFLDRKDPDGSMYERF